MNNTEETSKYWTDQILFFGEFPETQDYAKTMSVLVRLLRDHLYSPSEVLAESVNTIEEALTRLTFHNENPQEVLIKYS